VKWKTFIILCLKYIQDNKYKILSELAWFCRQCDKNIWCVFLGSQFQLLFTYKTQRQVSQGNVATLFRRAGKRLYYCIANLFRTMCTEFYQNRLGFITDVIKHFGVFFSLHSVYSSLL